jgi:hypothetical protein
VRWDKQLLRDRPDLRHFNDAAYERVFTIRGIHPMVRDSRPYTPYDAGFIALQEDGSYGPDDRALDVILNEDPGLGGDERGSTEFKANQRPGIVMKRWGFGSSRRQLAQLRPFKWRELDPGLDLSLYAPGGQDEGVFTGRITHDHHAPEMHAHRGDHFVYPNSRSTRQQAAARRDTDPSEVEARRAVRDEAAARRMRRHIDRDHAGIAPPDGQAHEHPARVDAAHLTKRHQGEDVEGVHHHEKRAKYVYPSAKAGTPFLIDCHPYARPLVEAGGDICYFALEGLLKADAILSVGFTGYGTGTPVINCGSVTLWADPELPSITETYLTRFDLVVVVPDSDGSGNRLVSSAANQLCARLQKYGAAAVVAAPPATCGPKCEHLTRFVGYMSDADGNSEAVMLPNPDHKQGVDDFLGSGGALADLIVDVTGDPARVVTVDELKAQSVAAGHRKATPRAKSDAQVLAAILDIANPQDGIAVFNQEQIAAHIGRSRHVVRASVPSLVKRGLILQLDSDFLYHRPDRYPPTMVRVVDLDLIPGRTTVTLAEYTAARAAA